MTSPVNHAPSPGTGDDLLRATIRDAATRVPAGQRVGVAVSGGADSLFLLEVMRVLAHERRDPAPCVLHVDHGVRGVSSKADARFVESRSRSLGLSCRSRTLVWRGPVSEDRLRRARYHALSELAEEAGIRWISLGHHQDDQLETLLLRLLRGTGLTGLRGIPRQRPLARGSDVTIIRPLLEVTGVAIREWLRARDIPFREDASNRDTRFSRNAIRHELIPALSGAGVAGLRGMLLEIAESAELLEVALQETARSRLAKATSIGDVAISRADFLGWPLIEQTALLRLWAEELTGAAPRLGSGEEIRHFVERARTHQRRSLGRGLELIVQYGALRLRREPSPPVASPTALIPGPGSYATELGSLEVEETDSRVIDRDPDREIVDVGRVPFPWRLRLRRPGDRFHPLGAPGSKKLKDFLSDEKVPDEGRRRCLLLENEASIIWVVGHRLDQRARFDARSQRLVMLRFRQPSK
ncbi:MAG: tRNA lysidine(34) synthetase TilS [Planctomycetota bacterium]